MKKQKKEAPIVEQEIEVKPKTKKKALNEYREEVLSYDADQVKAPHIIAYDLAKDIAKFRKKHEVTPDSIRGKKAMLYGLNIRNAAIDAQLEIIEDESISKITLSFGKE